MKIKKLYLTSLVILFWLSANGQIFSKDFFESPRQDSLKFGYFFDYLPYLKNNEYFVTIIKGYTLIGQQLRSGIEFSPSKNIYFNLGLSYNQLFGSKNYQFYPLLRMNLKFNRLSITTGNLYGGVQHRLLNQIMSYESFIWTPEEYGIQIYYKTAVHDFQTWINWRQFIYYKAPYPERLDFGINYWLSPMPKKQNFWLNAQLLIAHTGGQIDSSNSPTITAVNAALGYKFLANLTQNLNLELKNYMLIFYEPTHTAAYKFTKGYGLWLNLRLKYKNLSISQAFWQGAKFYSPLGDIYFSNFNPYNGQTDGKKTILPTTIDFTKHISPILFLKIGFFSYLVDYTKLDYGYYFVIRCRFANKLNTNVLQNEL